jgi:hypothetical protein
MWASSWTVVLSRCAVLTSLRTLTSITSPPTVTPFAAPRYRLPGAASSKLYPASLISLTVSSNASVGSSPGSRCGTPPLDVRCRRSRCPVGTSNGSPSVCDTSCLKIL